jgi:hypothetical protein
VAVDSTSKSPKKSYVGNFLECLGEKRGNVNDSAKGVIPDGGRSDETQLIALLTGQQVTLDKISDKLQTMGDTNSVLSDSDRKRYRSIFTILKDVIMPKGPEADSLKASNVGKVAEVGKLNQVQSKEADNSSCPKLLALALGALGIVAVAGAMFEALGPVGRFIAKMVPKLGDMLKTVKTLFTNAFTAIDVMLRTIGKIIPSITSAIADAFAGIRTFLNGNKLVKSFVEGLEGVAKKGGSLLTGAKAAGSGLFDVLKGALRGIGGPLLKKLKFVPYIGGLIGLGFAYKRFKDKDYIPATFELISAILDFIPAAGWVASSLIDGGLLLYDMYKAKEEKKAGTGQPKQGFLSYIASAISTTLGPKLEYIPVIGGLIQVGKALKLFYNGDLSGGLKMFGSSILAFVGGKGLSDLVGGGINLLTSLLSNKAEKVRDYITGGSGDSWSDILNKVWKRVREIVPKKIKEIRDWAINSVTKFIPFLDGGADDILSPDGLTQRNEFLRKKDASERQKQAKIRQDQASANTKQPVVTDNLQVNNLVKEINQQQLNTLNIISTNIIRLVEIGKANLNNKPSRELKNSSNSPTKIKDNTAPIVRNLDIRDDFTNAYSLAPSS